MKRFWVCIGFAIIFFIGAIVGGIMGIAVLFEEHWTFNLMKSLILFSPAIFALLFILTMIFAIRANNKYIEVQNIKNV